MDERDRQHQLRQAVGAQHDEPADETCDHAADEAGQRHQKRVGDAEMDGANAGRISAGAEQRRLSERCDAAIAGDEIERQHQQGDGDNAGQEGEVVGKQQIADCGNQEDGADADEVASDGSPSFRHGPGIGAGGSRHQPRLPARPCGNRQTMAMTAR